MAKLVAYDQQAVLVVLRDWTVDRLMWEVESGRFATRLSDDERALLIAVASAWSKRALGLVTLRDALMVDAQRGRYFYPLICTEAIRAVCDLPASLIARDASSGATLDIDTVQSWLLPVSNLNPSLPESDGMDDQMAMACFAGLLERARREELTLIYAPNDKPDYPLPELDRLLPASPTPVGDAPGFDPPRGWRRGLAMLLAVAGVASLVMPFIAGHFPSQPAGWPLALLTAALLVGIRAATPGYIGSFCLWLVANMPAFHHGRLSELLPAVPLLVSGVVFLMIDRRIRLLWSWLRRRQHSS